MSKINYANKVALNIDPSVAAINKCQADDMNSIKNAINQGGSFTTLTINANTGVFYCSLEGTLATNDIIKVNVPTTTGNVNWYVSVDNDTTNYVVLYEDGTNVKPVDVSGKNVELYFNGTNFVLMGSAVQNAYSTSTTVPYSANYVNEIVDGYELFSSPTDAGVNTDVTLSDSAANYSMLKIIYTDNDGYVPPAALCYNCNGKRIILYEIHQQYVKYKEMNVSGTSMNNAVYGQVNVATGQHQTTSNFIYIVKVIGYK